MSPGSCLRDDKEAVGGGEEPTTQVCDGAAAGGGEQRSAAFSWRALVIGMAAVVITCITVCFAELVVGKIQIGFLQLPPVAVGVMVLLLGVQTAFVSRVRGLRAHELFTIYIMMLLATMVSSRGLLQKLIPLLVVANYSPSESHLWKALFYDHIPGWAVPFDTAGETQQFVASRFFEGLRAGERLPWNLWVRPLFCWGVFVSLIFFAFLCLAVILRRQWVDNEKLVFPLVQLPLEMVRRPANSRTGFFRNRMMWLGFAVPAIVFGFNGLHEWYPSFPAIPVDIDLKSFMTDHPWSDVGILHIYCSFAVVGFFYLLPSDLLFSLWFFFLLLRAQEVVAAAMGHELAGMPMYPTRAIFAYQGMGAYFVLVGYMAYAAWPHLKRVIEAVRYGSRDEDEVLSYRIAALGLIASLLLAAGWMTLLGMSYRLALFELVILVFVVALVMARSTSEAGMLMTETTFRPLDVYRMFGDVRLLGGANLTGMAFLDGLWMRDQRGLILTGFLDSMKLADGVRVRRRSLLGVFALALGLSLLVSGYLHIALPYSIGASRMYSYVYQGNPVWAFGDSAAMLSGGTPPLAAADLSAFGIGVVVTLVLATLRTRLLWFPLHPLGYAIAPSFTMIVFWFPCMVAWILKSLILRYGGNRLYTQARPFFLGMVLGEFTMAVLWTVPSLFFNTPTPFFPWG